MHVIDGERQAYWRGVEKARHDERWIGEPNPAPLSGEWAGESVPELLGDLVAGVMRGDSGRDLDEGDVFDALCDAFELGYMGAFPDTLSKTYSVCGGCYYVLHNGWDSNAREWITEDETRERPAGVFPFEIEDVADALYYECFADASFSRRACECCGSTLGGERYEMRVWHRPGIVGMVIRCEWFASCTRTATWLVRHPVLGDVPACGECVRVLELADARAMGTPEQE